MKSHQTKIEERIVMISAKIISASATVRFPCYFYAIWQTLNQQSSVQTQKVQVISGNATFNQTITSQFKIPYDAKSKLFHKYETQLQLNLVSKSRQELPKLVGRTTINIADVLNSHQYTTQTVLPLQFSSTKAQILLSFEVQNKIIEDTISLVQSNEKESVEEVLKEIPSDILEQPIEQKSNQDHANSPMFLNENSKDKKVLKTSPSPFESFLSEKQSSFNVEKKTNQREKPESVNQSQKNSEVITPKNHHLRQSSSLYLMQKMTLKNELELFNIDLKKKQLALLQSQTQKKGLKDQLANSKDELRKKIQENINLSLTIAQLNDNNTKINNRIMVLERQQKKNEGLNQKVKTLEQQNFQFSLSKKSFEAKIKDLQNKIDNLSKQNSQKNDQISKYKATINELETKTYKLTNEIVGLKSELKIEQSKLIKQDQRMKNFINDIDTQRLKFKEKIQLEKQKLILLQSQKSQATKLSHSLQLQIDHLKRTIQSSQQTIKDKESLIIKISKQKEQDRIQTSKTKQGLSEKIKQIEKQYDNDIKQLKKQITKLKNIINEHEEKFKNIEDDLSNKNAEIINLRNIEHSLKTELAKKQNLIISLNESISLFEQTALSQQQSIENLSLNLAHVEQRLQKQQKQNMNLKQSLKDLQLQKQKDKQISSQLVNNLQNNIKSLSDKQNQLDTILQQKENEIQNFSLSLKDCEEYQKKLSYDNEYLIETLKNMSEKINSQKEAHLKDQQQSQSKIFQLEKMIRQMNDLLGKLQDQQQNIIQQNNQLKKDSQSKIELIQKLKNGLSQQVNRNEQINIDIVSFEERESKIVSKIEDLQKEKNEFNIIIQELQKQQQQKSQRINVLNRQITSMQQQLMRQKQYSQQLINQIQQQNIQAEQFQVSYQQKLQAIVFAEEEISKMQQMCDQYAKDMSQLQNTISIKQAEINKLEKQFKDSLEIIQNQCQRKEDFIQKNMENIKQFKASLTQKESYIEVLEKKIDKLDEEISQLANQHQKQGKLINLSKDEQKSHLQSTYRTQLTKREEHIKKLEQQLKKSQSKSKELTDYLQNINQQLFQKQQSIVSVTQKLNETQRHTQEQMSNLHLKVHTLEQKISELQREKLQKEKIIHEQSYRINEKQDYEQFDKNLACQLENVLKDNSQNRSKDQRKKDLCATDRQQQIIELYEDIQRLSKQLQEIPILKEKLYSLEQALESQQEDKFNFEAILNEKDVIIEELRRKNALLVQQNAILSEKNDQLQVMMYVHESKLESSNINQLQNLREKVKAADEKAAKLQEQLEFKDELHVVQLINQQVKLGKSQNISQTMPILPSLDLPQLLKSLKQILHSRATSSVNTKSLLSQDFIQKPSRIPEFARSVSLQLQKLKVKLFKGVQKIQLSILFVPCESAIRNLCTHAQLSNVSSD